VEREKDVPDVDPIADSSPAGPPAAPFLTAFVCANCGRGGVMPAVARPRPSLPDFEWPFAVKNVPVPCTGKLQPEHLLKAFEQGADAVCVIACEAGNCHHLEGSLRAERRVEYVRQLLAGMGLGPERLMMFHLPGSARQDMALGSGDADGQDDPTSEELTQRVRAIRDEVVARLESLAPNPLRGSRASAGLPGADPEAG
jgi:coenzyme F420-reducing hydrogenase delta subunit